MGFVTRLLLFVGVPLLELYLLAAVEDRIGLGPTLLLVVGTGIVGASSVRRQGARAWRAIQASLAEGRVPSAEIAHGVLVLVGGVLLITPGILTDLVGLLLMIPVVRELVRLRFRGVFRVVVW